MKIGDIESKYSLTEKVDLEWVTKKQKNPDELKQLYMGFIKKRFEKIIDILIENYGNL